MTSSIARGVVLRDLGMVPSFGPTGHWWGSSGMLAVYFAGQSSFALYMKLVLSEETISRDLNLRGMPAAFLVTAIQQAAQTLMSTCLKGERVLSPAVVHYFCFERGVPPAVFFLGFASSPENKTAAHNIPFCFKGRTIHQLPFNGWFGKEGFPQTLYTIQIQTTNPNL